MATALAATNHVAMADLKGKVDPDWCPGCGDFGVLAAVQKALVELQIPNHNVVTISGIGCSSNFPGLANGCPPGRMWQDTQCPSAARTSPLATDSAAKLAGFGRSTGAIAARQDNKEKPSSPRKTKAIIAIAIRRIVASRPESGFAALRMRPMTKTRLSPCD